jgi:hypothetical protein
MATDDSSNTSPAPQIGGQAELSALADRLKARAESVLFRDQPEQARDLRSAAVAVDYLVFLRGELRRAADATGDESTERHLRELVGGQ